jgi:hypothetical protein
MYEPGGFTEDIRAFTKQVAPALDVVSMDFGRNYRIAESKPVEEGGDRWTYELPEKEPRVPHAGIWMAGCVSPRGLLEDGPFRGMPILHMVVMRGASLVWDPHPQREMGVGPVVSQVWWVAADPAAL